MDESRSHKRQKTMPVVRIVKRNATPPFYSMSTTVLEVLNNYQIKSVKNCPNLTIANLVRTRISAITDCPVLYSLKVVNNSRLIRIDIPSLHDVVLRNINTLKLVKLVNAVIATLDNLNALEYVFMPNVVELTVANLSYKPKYESMLQQFPNLRTLHLTNVKQFPFYNKDYHQPLSKLVISQCDLGRLTGLDGYGEVIIQDCLFITSIDSLRNIKTLSIQNCPQLRRVQDIQKVNEISISRCNSLQKVLNIESSFLTIEYCFSIVSLPAMAVDSIKLSHCPTFSGIVLHSNITQLIVTDCSSLDFVEFNCENVDSYDRFKLELNGNNQLAEIKDWFVSDLTIKNNSSLESIANVYNLGSCA